MSNYYKWFRIVINFCIYFFFIFALVSNLCLYASVFSGFTIYLVFVILAIALILFVYFFKNKIKVLLDKLFCFLKNKSEKELLIYIVLIAIILKVIAYILFFFDSTLGGGDITIYASIADRIVQNGFDSVKDEIYYLAGMGMHLAVFKYLGIASHLGVFIAFLLGTIINYYSFKDIMGKEKSFLAIVLYLIMPSTSLLTFCCTHELFVYLYFSIILFILNKFFRETNIKKSILYSILLWIFISLNQTVSPIGKIWYIVIVIIILLSNTKIIKKLLLVGVLLLTMVTGTLTSTGNEDNYISQLNNVEQLLIGSNVESGGHHTDGRGKDAPREYWAKQGVELTYDNLLEGEIGALKETYLHLLTHPSDLIKLLSNKFFTAWSGDVYSVELGHAFGGYGDIAYYAMLFISSIIYLFVMCIAVFFYKKEENEEIYSLNYKMILLGIVAVLLVVEIANKYSCYMTMFIYFVALFRSEVGKKNGQA